MEEDAMHDVEPVDRITREVERALGETPSPGLSVHFTRRVSERAFRMQDGSMEPFRILALAPGFALGAATALLLLVAVPLPDDIRSLLVEPFAWTFSPFVSQPAVSTFLAAAAGLCLVWTLGQLRGVLAARAHPRTPGGTPRP